MKTLYIDCGMGAAGDMLTAALLELLPDREAFTEELNHIGIPEVTYRPETAFKCGIKGTHMHVLVSGEEESEHMHDHHHDHGHDHDHDHEHAAVVRVLGRPHEDQRPVCSAPQGVRPVV